MQSSPSVYCDICGAANRPQARFCFACGQPLQQGASVLATGTSRTTTGLLPAAHLLRGRYRIKGCIGRGGFGAVYQAEDTLFASRPLAIKEMSQQHLSSQDLQAATAAFQHEASLLAGLMHPNLPRIYDHFCEGGRWYLVMDYLAGETLEDRLARAPGGRLPLAEVLPIAMQLCTVLGYLHSRQPPIIFRDLKPANVIVTPEGHVYLIDFGIARFFKPGQARDTVAFGSAGYAAPEQYGKAQSTPRTDIYALGATLHQLITGQDPSLSPFQFAPFPQQDEQHRRLESLVMRMVQLESDRRPASMDEVRRALEQLQAAPRQRPTQPGGQTPAVLTWQQAGSTPPFMISRCLYRGHRQAVRALAWSPDGRLLASGGRDGRLHIWEALSGRQLLTCKGHKGPLYAVAWAPNGQRLASGGRDGTVRLWRASDGSPLLIYQGHSSYVHSLAWAPDSTYLASASEDHTVHVWSANDPGDHAIYRGHTKSVKAVAWAPNGQRLASGGAQLRIWSRPRAKGRRLFSYLLSYMEQLNASELTIRTYPINALAWSPDGRYLAAGRTNTTVGIWETQRGHAHLTYRLHSRAVLALAWRPRGWLIASGGRDGQVDLWQVFDGRRLASIALASTVYALAWSPDGHYLAAACQDGSVQVWEIPY